MHLIGGGLTAGRGTMGVLLQTLMTTISFCLEEKATFEVASAWTNLGAYVLRAMLPGAIKVGIIPSRSHIEIQSLFQCHREADVPHCALDVPSRTPS